MPKTRNVNHSQRENTNTTTTSSTRTSTRRRNEKENGYESEKENMGRRASRATRAQTRARGPALGLLGTTNTPVLSATTAGKAPLGEKSLKKTAAKGKGKPTPGPLKQKKLPLQDITADFLPTFQVSNRGQGEEGPAEEAVLNEEETANRVVAANSPPDARCPSPQPFKFTSPLPPSSPPSEQISSPIYQPMRTGPVLYDSFAILSNQSLLQEPYDAWQEFDNAQAASQACSGNVSSNSDPFGFVALERKLKVERQAAALSGPAEQPDQEDWEDLGNILVADTSSPRPVRRLKRALEVEDAEPINDALSINAFPHFQTPPTPHKDKQKRRRMSHEGHDIFSPCSSSIGSSPSPTKVSARKTPYSQKDPLDEFNEELDRSFEMQNSLKNEPLEKAAKAIGSDAISRNLRPRDKRPAQDEDKASDIPDDKPLKVSVKSRSTKKSVNNPRSATSKKGKAEVNDEDDEGNDEVFIRVISVLVQGL